MIFLLNFVIQPCINYKNYSIKWKPDAFFPYDEYKHLIEPFKKISTKKKKLLELLILFLNSNFRR